MTQQLRDATAWGDGPSFLIRDNNAEFGTRFDDVAEGIGITILRTPVRAPNANACCERFLRSVRAACLASVLILDEGHLASILQRYGAYFNDARPHQGIAQKIPSGPPNHRPSAGRSRKSPSSAVSTTTTGGPPRSDGSGSQYGVLAAVGTNGTNFECHRRRGGIANCWGCGGNFECAQQDSNLRPLDS